MQEQQEADYSEDEIWSCTDEIKCVPSIDIVNNLQTVKWTQYTTKLTSPMLVQAYAHVTNSFV